MNITTQGYNVPKVTFGTSITPSTSTIIGTKDEFQQLNDDEECVVTVTIVSLS